MSVPAYESYRDSGVEWLRQLPSHWDLDRLKASIVDCRNGVWGEEADGGEDDVLCIRVADFDRTALRVSLVAPTLRRVTPRERAERLVHAGDLLIEKSGGGEKQSVGAVVLFSHTVPAVCSNFVGRMRLAPGMVPTYWLYVHSAAYAVRLTVRSINQTSGIQNLDQWRYFEERAPFPPAAEQAAIAAFLDRETAKIDALVEEQRRMIDLLKEKRQAVISHAVTKGLDPSVPMKDSGVESIGAVPTHWVVSRIKNLTSVISKGTTPSTIGADFTAEGTRFLKAENIAGGQVLSAPEFYIDEDTHAALRRSALRSQDILVVIAGATTGKSAILPATMVPANTNQAVSFIRCKRSTDAVFVQNWLESSNVQSKILTDSVQSAQPNLSMESLGNLPIPIPPPDEMIEIADFIARSKERLSALIAEADAAITILQERRSALISAAVTGKIDVRGLVTSAAEAA